MDTLSNENPKENNTTEEIIPEGAVPINEEQQIVIAYTNYKGISSVRRIIPKNIYFGSSKWHPEPQWLLEAFDLNKKAERHFAMTDIHSWQ